MLTRTTSKMANTSVYDTHLFDLGAMPIFKVICLLFNAAAIVGNSLACAVFLTQRNFQSCSLLLFQLNQCVVDLCTPIIIILQVVIPKTEYFDQSLASRLICWLWSSHLVLSTLLSVSIVNLSLMSMERYCAFYYPVKHRLWFTCGGKARLLILLNWLSTSIICGVTIIPSKGVDEQSGKCVLYRFSMYAFFGAWSICIFVIIFPMIAVICLVRIYVRFNHLAKKCGVVHGAAIQNAKYSLFVTIISLFVLTMAVELPMSTLLFINRFEAVNWTNGVIRFLVYLSIFCLTLKCLGTSLIYSVANKRFRDKLAVLLWKHKRKFVRNKVFPLDTL